MILKKKRFRPEPLVSQMEKVRPRGPEELSGEPSHLPLPRPGNAWKDAGKRAAVAWLWASCPGPAERGGVGRGVSPAPVPGGRRLCSPCGEEIYSPQELGAYREKAWCCISKGCCLQHPRWAGFRVGPAPPGSKNPSKGQLWGRVRGKGQRVLSRSETPPLSTTHTQNWCWAPGPGEGSCFCTVLSMSLGCSGLF